MNLYVNRLRSISISGAEPSELEFESRLALPLTEINVMNSMCHRTGRELIRLCELRLCRSCDYGFCESRKRVSPIVVDCTWIFEHHRNLVTRRALFNLPSSNLTLPLSSSGPLSSFKNKGINNYELYIYKLSYPANWIFLLLKSGGASLTDFNICKRTNFSF